VSGKKCEVEKTVGKKKKTLFTDGGMSHDVACAVYGSLHLQKVYFESILPLYRSCIPTLHLSTNSLAASSASRLVLGSRGYADRRSSSLELVLATLLGHMVRNNLVDLLTLHKDSFSSIVIKGDGTL